MPESFDQFRKYLQYHFLVAWRTKAFWLRAFVCWLVGAALLIYDEGTNFDLRLKVRGPVPTTGAVVLVDVNERDWATLNPETRNVLRPLKEVIVPNDSYFWNAKAWEKLLSRVLSSQPKAVGVSFYFGENIRSPQAPITARTVFEDPRVVWAADVDNTSRMLLPLFASTYNSNVGLRNLRADDDGTVRRFNSSSVHVPHLAVRLATVAHPELTEWAESRVGNASIINFHGDATTSFTVLNARDLIEGRTPTDAIAGKVVIIGNLSNTLEQIQTPLGRMSRSEAIANITENILQKETVARWPRALYLILLALMMVGAIKVIATYPQSVALVVFLLSGIVWISVSIWAFDVYQIWLPVFSPLVQLLTTCLVFLSYQLAINERRTWRLEQEQKYISEIEQLKTNFVSMMSHDLKTPIAKIQAICDRMLASSQDPAITQDLKSLRRSSDELHRYIQSILKVTKVEAKDFQIQKEVTDINENIERVIGRLAPLGREKHIRITTKLEPMFSIEVDTTLIEEVIHNLIENAIKYTPASAEHPGLITVTSEEKDDNVVVVIQDTGPGIDPEDQKEIWGKFTRGRVQQTATAGEIKGTGLGLYLVKYFVELHGGRVFLESAPGRGTRIGFTIPLATESESPAAPMTTPALGEV